jgi:hypothetical protein
MNKQKLFTLVDRGLPIINILFRFGLYLLSLVVIICAFVPLYPEMPTDGLDPSWKFAMNQAIANHLTFGKDIVFTFGPYASIYTKLFHPASDYLMIGGALYLAMSYWIAFVSIAQDAKLKIIVSFIVAFSCLIYSRDALLFSYALLAGIFCFKLTDKSGANISIRTIALTAYLFSPLGLLPLIKGSLSLICASTSVLAFILFFFKKRFDLAVTVLISPILSGMFFWLLAGQPFGAYPHYFISMAPIISGYTEAMSSYGKSSEISHYIIASSVLLICIALEKVANLTSKIFIFLAFFIFIFISFKAGFVRHDGHAITASYALLLASIFYCFTFSQKYSTFVVVGSLIAWVHIDSNYTKTSTVSLSSDIKSTYLNAWGGLKIRLTEPSKLSELFDQSIQNLRIKGNIPLLKGSTDIYSYEQSYLISSGNIWNPRPILQSYSAYLPSLEEKNRIHVSGKDAPDNIIFKIEPIDDRLPSIEDGSSWSELLFRYTPITQSNNFLYLSKAPIPIEIPDKGERLTRTYSFGQQVIPPKSSGLMFAEIETNLTFLGKAANVLYKPSSLQIDLELENGTKKNYRLVSGMLKSKFLLSPLVENTDDFSSLYRNEIYFIDKKVKSFSISPIKHASQWSNAFTVTFETLANPNAIAPANLWTLNTTLAIPSPLKMPISKAEKCEGTIDSINGISPSPDSFSARGMISLSGWLAGDMERKKLPEAVYIVLTDSESKNTIYSTTRTSRSDVAAYLKMPFLGESGYSTKIDISSQRGKFVLQLAYKESGTLKICPQYNIQARFGEFISNAK